MAAPCTGVVAFSLERLSRIGTLCPYRTAMLAASDRLKPEKARQACLIGVHIETLSSCFDILVVAALQPLGPYRRVGIRSDWHCVAVGIAAEKDIRVVSRTQSYRVRAHTNLKCENYLTLQSRPLKVN